MAETYQGSLCKRGHDAGEGFSVRYCSTGGCVLCKKNENSQLRRLEYQRGHKEEKKAYYHAHKEVYREGRRAYHLKRTYGITWEDKMDMFLKQGRKCAICDRSWDSLTKNVHVDHCHRRNVVRGLLCTGCNTKLGRVEEYLYNLDGTKSAINTYLMKGMDMVDG